MASAPASHRLRPMRLLVWVSLVAVATTVAAQSRFVVLSEPGFACKELTSAKTHETLRTKKDATPYEVAAAMQLPGCVQADTLGVRLWVATTDESDTFLRVDNPEGRGYNPYWIPRRMTKPAP